MSIVTDYTEISEKTAAELRELLTEIIDALVLPGHVVTRERWEDALVRTGRFCEPYISKFHGERNAPNRKNDGYTA